jgi:hypothetical protein
MLIRKKWIFLVFIFVILCSFSILDIFYKKTYIYRNVTGNLHSKITWLIKKKKDDFVMSKMAKDGIAKFVYSPTFSLKKYGFESAEENKNFTLTLDKGLLILKGKVKGKKIDKRFKISNYWIQDFNFGLKNFLDSKYAEKTFVIVNPDDFSTHKMIAYKKEIKKIKINDREYNARKVIITLPGFQSNFWQADVWYDLENNDLLKYQADEGPGTSVTTITFESKD